MNSIGNANPTTNSTKERTKNESIKVCIRVRPLLEHEDSEFWMMDRVNNTISTINSSQSYKSNDLSRGDALSSTSGKEKDIRKLLIDSVYTPQSFSFDKIYDNNSNSQLIYKEFCRDITKSVINGYNGTVFMYGQTTSGKTFTMLGTPKSPGLLPCALRDTLSMIQKESNPGAFNVYCSYIEIYNENIRDLLTESSNLKLVDDGKYGVIVVGSKRVKIKSFEDGISLKDYGEENRKYRETLINEYSSRSHTIFQIFVETDLNQYNPIDMKEGFRYSCLNLVDLAGSERLTDYDTKSEAFGETGHINKSLFVLANVVNKLSEGKNTYIPYRDSKLTRVLSQALGGNSLTAVICTVSPAALNYYQTLSTLRFATRAKIVKTKAKVNEFMDDKSAIEYYKNEVKKLQDELRNKNSIANSGINNNNSMNFNLNVNNLPSNHAEINQNDSNISQKNLNEFVKKTNESLVLELENYKEKYFSEKGKNEIIQNEILKLRNFNNSQNFQTSNDFLFPDNINYNTNPINGFDNMNYSSNYYSNKSNRMKNPMFYNNPNFWMYPPTNFFHPFNNFNNFNSISEQNSLNFNQNNNLNESLFIENLMNKIGPYVYEKSNFDSWCEAANKINKEYVSELRELQNRHKKKFLDIVYNNFNLVEDSTRPGFKFASDKNNSNIKDVTSTNTNLNLNSNSKMNYPLQIENKINYDNKKKIKREEEITPDIKNKLDHMENSKTNREREKQINKYKEQVIENSQFLKENSYMNFNDNININTPNKNENSETNILDDEILIKINEQSIFNDINLIFKIYSFETKENNLRILKRNYEEKLDNLEKRMEHYKNYLENFYRKQIQKSKNSQFDNLENFNENLPMITITSEHNEKLKMLRELHQEKLKELEKVKNYD